MVARDDGPAIAQLFDVAATRIDHRLDGEGHAGLELFQGAWFAIVQNLRLFMKNLTDAMTAKLADHRKAVAFCKLLNGPPNVTQPSAGLDFDDAVPHGFVGQLAKPLGSNRGFADNEHATGVTMPAIFDHGDVNVDNVALFQGFVVGDAMANLMVDRSANRLGVGVVAIRGIVQWGRNTALNLCHVVVRQLVKLVGGDAGLDVGRQKIQNLAYEPYLKNYALVFLPVEVDDKKSYPCLYYYG